MTWLWVILIVAAIGGIIGYLSSGKSEDAAAGAVGAGMGCAYIHYFSNILSPFRSIHSI